MSAVIAGQGWPHLTEITTESALVWEHMQVLGKLSGPNEANLVWIPGYRRILGNKEVGNLAKKGTNTFPDQIASIPFAMNKNHHV